MYCRDSFLRQNACITKLPVLSASADSLSCGRYDPLRSSTAMAKKGRYSSCGSLPGGLKFITKLFWRRLDEKEQVYFRQFCI